MVTNRKKISIKDVAEMAGVSPTTVSRVINNSDHSVSEKTREKVQSVIDRLEFEPNRMAQGLIKNKSNIIGVIVHDISDEYFAEMVKGIEEVVVDYDYIVSIYNTDRDIDKELRSVRLLKANRADALVFTGGSILDGKYEKMMGKYIEEFKNQGSQVIGVTPGPFMIKQIKTIAHEESARKITEYLINNGHQEIAYVNGPAFISTARERLAGYKNALDKYMLEIKDNNIIEGDFSFEGGRQAAKKILEQNMDITAVIGANDVTALGILWELRDQGIAVPEDISVAGIGNIPQAKYAYPPLTTVSIPLHQVGRQIGEYILSSLEEKVDINQSVAEITLVERDSVRKIEN